MNISKVKKDFYKEFFFVEQGLEAYAEEFFAEHGHGKESMEKLWSFIEHSLLTQRKEIINKTENNYFGKIENEYWKEVSKLLDDTGYFDHTFVLDFFRWVFLRGKDTGYRDSKNRKISFGDIIKIKINMSKNYTKCKVLPLENKVYFCPIDLNIPLFRKNNSTVDLGSCYCPDSYLHLASRGFRITECLISKSYLNEKNI